MEACPPLILLWSTGLSCSWAHLMQLEMSFEPAMNASYLQAGNVNHSPLITSIFFQTRLTSTWFANHRDEEDSCKSVCRLETGGLIASFHCCFISAAVAAELKKGGNCPQAIVVALCIVQLHTCTNFCLIGSTLIFLVFILKVPLAFKTSRSRFAAGSAAIH